MFKITAYKIAPPSPPPIQTTRCPPDGDCSACCTFMSSVNWGFLGFIVGKPQISWRPNLAEAGHMRHLSTPYKKGSTHKHHNSNSKNRARHERIQQWKAAESKVHQFMLTCHCAVADAVTVRTGPHTGSYSNTICSSY